MPVQSRETLKSYFNNGDVPSETEYFDLIDTLFDRSGGIKHSELLELNFDDHLQYVHLSSPRIISAQHSFSPEISRPPFSLNENARNQTVIGLKADELNKSVIAGTGLSGGGTLDSNLTLNINQDSSLNWSVPQSFTDINISSSVLVANLSSLPSNPPANISREIVKDGYPLSLNSNGVIIPRMVARWPFDIMGGYLTGSASRVTINNAPAIAFPDSAISILDMTWAFPAGWQGRTFETRIFCSFSNTNTGNSEISVQLFRLRNNTDIAATQNGGSKLISGNGIVNRIKMDSISIVSGNFSEGDACSFRVYRNGSGANDSFTGTFYLLGLEVRVS